MDTLKWNNEIVQSTAASIARAAWLLLTVGSDVACCISHTHTYMFLCGGTAMMTWCCADDEVRLIILCQYLKKLFCSWGIILFSFFYLFLWFVFIEIFLSSCCTVHSCACFTCEPRTLYHETLYRLGGLLPIFFVVSFILLHLVCYPHTVYMKQWFPVCCFGSYMRWMKFAQCCSVAKLKHETFTGIIRQGILKLHQPNKDKSVCLSFIFLLQLFASWYGVFFCMLWHKSLLVKINIFLSDVESWETEWTAYRAAHCKPVI